MRLGVVTDIHLVPLPHPPARWHNDYDFEGVAGRLEASLEALTARGVDAIAVLGDLTDDGDAGSLDAVLAAVERAGPPVLVVPGNHDCEPDMAALEQAVARSGGHVSAAVTQSVQVAGTPVAGVTLARPDRGTGFDAAGLPDLPGPTSVVLTHFPTVSRRRQVTGAGFKYAGDLANLGLLAAHVEAAQAPVVAVSGHLHVRDAVAQGRLLQLLVPALIEPPFECAVVELGGDPVTVTYEAIAVAPTPAGLDVPLLSPPTGSWMLGEQGWEAAATG